MKTSIQTLIWSSVAIALLIAGSLAFLPKPVEVETAVAVARPLTKTVQEDGKTRIREKYIISAPVAGRLSRIELDPGDPVSSEGTLLAIIQPAEPAMLDARAKATAKARVEQASAALQRAKASVDQTQVQFDLAKSKLDRLKKLENSQAVSQIDLDEAQAAFLTNSHSLRTAKFDTEIAKFELEMAKAALLQFNNEANSDSDSGHTEPFEVYAPIQGKVLRVFQESSTVMSVGTPLIEVGDPSNLEMEIDVLSTDAVRITVGAEISVEHWGGDSPLRGRVRVVEPAAFTKVSSLGVEEQRVNVIADFDEPSEKLLSLGDGYRVEANIVIDQLSNALCIPNSALFRYQGEWHVFAIQNDLAKRVPVEVGLQNETLSQITRGLDTDDQVVLYPSDELEDGSKVEVTNR